MILSDKMREAALRFGDDVKAAREGLGLEPEDYGFQHDLVYLAKIAEWRKKTHTEK